MRKALFLILLLLALILVLPLFNGYMAEREIRNFFRRSLVGEKAVTSYERGYLTSECQICFNARDLMRRNLSEKELRRMEGTLTQLVLQSSFSIYHCPSLKDRTFYCKGEGQTVIKAPGDIAKAIDLKASLGWDACVRASFNIPGGKIDSEVLEALLPGYAIAQAVDCEIADIEGGITIPLNGKETSIICRAHGMDIQDGGFSNFVLRGGSRLLAENIRAYSFTGDLDRVEGGVFSAEKGQFIMSGTVSNDLHNVALSLHSDTKIAERSLPVDFRLDLANCDIKRLNELRTGVMGLKQRRNNAFDLSLISQVAEALESGKAFLSAKPNLGCDGTLGMPEGDANLKFRCDTSKVKLDTWKDIFRLTENLDGRLDMSVPKASLEEGGTLCELFGYSETLVPRLAQESNGYYVIHFTIKDLLTK